MSVGADDVRTAAARRRRLVVAGAVTAAATLWAALQADDPAPPPARQRPDATATGSPALRANARTTPLASASAPGWPEAPDARARPPWPDVIAQGAAAWNTTAPPSPPPASAVAPKPAVASAAQAPPFPYTLIGRIDDGEPRALLSGPLRSFGVKVADVIDGQWRVDAVLAQGLTLTWLPGPTRTTLVFRPS